MPVLVGTAPRFDDAIVGIHRFSFTHATFSEESALDGTTQLPLGIWYSYASEDLKPALPPGAQFLRIQLSSGASSESVHVDNVALVFRPSEPHSHLSQARHVHRLADGHGRNGRPRVGDGHVHPSVNGELTRGLQSAHAT